MTVRPAVPAYFDFLIEAFHQGGVGRFVHLGHWDHPERLDGSAPVDPCEFGLAQQRLNDRLLGMAGLSDGQSVLDVGCGFGGTIESLNNRFRRMRLVGLNLDSRQLVICQSLHAARENVLHWITADACLLPFAADTFDRVLCIEAMFHFASRRRFLLEAARVLRPGGRLVFSDMLLCKPASASPAQVETITAAVRREFGPWPDLWATESESARLAEAAGLECMVVEDVTHNTRPSHRFVVPDGEEAAWEEGDREVTGAGALRRLHEDGCLRYLNAGFRKPNAAHTKRRPHAP